MTYYEILMWIETHLVALIEVEDGLLQMTYLDNTGYTHKLKINRLIEGVLKINELELIIKGE